MLLMTTYKFKPFLSKDETRTLMALFAEHGTTEGVTAHYLSADGSFGVVFAESEDAAEGYRNILNYTEYVEYETRVVLTIDEALPHIADSLGG
jgi:hypothetical protein